MAGGLLAVAPFAVRYSNEARYYTLFSALALASWWLLLRAVRLRSWSGFVAYGVSLGLLALTHPFTPIVVAFQLLFLAVMGRIRRTDRATVVLVVTRVGVAVGIGVLIALPWYAYGLAYWSTHSTPYSLNPRGTFAVALDFDLYRRATNWILGNSSGFGVVAASLLALVVLGLVLARSRLRLVATACVVVVVASVAVLVPLSRLAGTYLAFRRIESLLPPVLLAAAVGIVVGGEWLARLVHREGWALPLAGGIMLVVVVFSGLATRDSYRREKSNYRELASTVRDAPDGATIVIGPLAQGWEPRVRAYLGWQGVGDRPVHYLRSGDEPGRIAWNGTTCPVIWITGSDPASPEFRTRALNDVARVDPVAGDASLGELVLPWYVSTSCPADRADLRRQADATSRVPAGIVRGG